MKWCEFQGVKVRYVIYSSRLHVLEKLGDDGAVVNLANSDKPLSTTFSGNKSFAEALFNIATDSSDFSLDYKDFVKNTGSEWAEELIKNKVSADELQSEKESYKQQVKKDTENKQKQHYETLYAEFRDYMLDYDMSALELVVATSRCLVADSAREVIRAFVGYFQTINSFKATNVIAVGHPAAGKSYILETALDMMPDEFVHRTIMTESAFFETYDGMDLTGHIFFLGDLGGANSDEKTINFRDLLKQLATDGEVSRTISKGDGKDREPIQQRVRGCPALTYSSADEEIINDQEKSRSIVLTPQPILPNKLLVFNSVQRNNGIFREDIVKLHQVRDSIKGLVYCFNRRDYDFYNPYMFNVISTFEEVSDFNRKIQEFDATLEVVTMIDKPYSIEHDLYYDDMEEQTSTRLIFPTKRNNLNAMNLFDAVDFLPDEARFGDQLIQLFKVFDLEKLDNGTLIDEDSSFEDNVIFSLTNESQVWVTDVDKRNGWQNGFFYNIHNGYFSKDYPEFQDYVFTVGSLKKKYGRNKWLKSNITYVSDRLRKLYEGGVLIKLGKTYNNENLYALSNENGEKISVKIPSFTDKSKINYSRKLFESSYPEYISEFDKFIEYDKEKPDETSLTESVPALFPRLPYIQGGE